MQTATVLLIILAAVVALGIAVFQYFYKIKRQKVNVWLAVLRFVFLFSGLLLIINPKFTKESYYIEKANLVVLIDNSTSINKLGGREDMAEAIRRIKSNTKLAESYKINTYTFGDNIVDGDSITYKANSTNISKALNSLNEIYGNSTSAIVLLTDGNQTLGNDYEYLQLNKNIHIYPIIVGDTTRHEDLRISQINVNKYAFLKNKFPVETTIQYSGNRSVNSVVRIYLDGKQVFRESVDFTINTTSKTLTTLLEANRVGIKSLKIEVEAITNEKNIINNTKEHAIEVIDEKTNIALISSIIHPDIGVLKKSIEANEQREVKIYTPNVALEQLEDVDVFILYQPNTAFKVMYDFIAKKGGGVFTITGRKTDWRFLNAVQSSFSKESYNQPEEILPVKNQGFGLFDISTMSFSGFPPLESALGEFDITKPYETIATQRIKGVELETPLFFIIDDEIAKEVVLFGENIWMWRVKTYRDERSFKTFDDFIGRLFRYLSSVKQKSRLNLTYENLYEGNASAKISASFFDKAYNFDANANLTITLKNDASGFRREAPMLLKENSYEYSLENLEPGTYEFTVSESKEKVKKSGTFKILDFNLEDQFLAANYKKLQRLSQNSMGTSYFPNEIETLAKDLQNDKRFTPVQKSNRNVVSLIDFRYLLFFMALALAIEWFIRKYNGLL